VGGEREAPAALPREVEEARGPDGDRSAHEIVRRWLVLHDVCSREIARLREERAKETDRCVELEAALAEERRARGEAGAKSMQSLANEMQRREEAEHALKALRAKARAVVDAYRDDLRRGRWSDVLLAAMDDLRAALPKETP
jgi:hypothetical protein